MNENSEIKKSIIRALCFFDIFNYPLTEEEIWRYSDYKCDLISVIKELDEMTQTKKIIEARKGFYFLKGRQEIIDVRQARYNTTDKKIKKTIRFGKLLKFIPGIKMIAVSNQIGSHNMRESSDIDLFIITEKDRIWMTRFFCVFITKILGLRPTPKNQKDKICLSFFISEEDLDLEKYKFINNDVYFHYWLAGLVPIYDVYGLYRVLIEKNDWLIKFLPNWNMSSVAYRRDVGSCPKNLYNKTFNYLFGLFSGSYKKIQLKILPKELRNIMNKDTRVVINDKVLKLISNDRRELYAQKYHYRIRVREKLNG